MKSGVDLADIEVSRLRLDIRNPRLAAVPDSQRDALGEMSSVQGPKLLVLCRHIAQHGLNPTQRFIVIPDDDGGVQYIVLDGNRRLSALKTLENPELAADRLSEPEMRQLKQIAAAYSPLEDVPCVVFPKRDDADPWIELIHDGESDGAGSVPWSAQQKARHRSRSGTKPVHLQVLEFVHQEGSLSSAASQKVEQGTFPVSTLERALTTPHVREQLGIEVVDGQVTTKYPKSEVLKGLSRLVDEIGTGAIKVGRLMSVADRVGYIDSFKDSELPAPATQVETASPLTQAPEKARSAPVAAKDRKPSTARVKLIPTAFTLEIPQARINDIYLELKRKLRVDEVPNAAGVLLRVFLELSVDDYMERNAITITQKRETLANKIDAVASFMESNQVMTKQNLMPVRESVQEGGKVTLATNLNALVHNRQMTVSGTDLKAIWHRLEGFFRAIWIA